MIKSGFTRLKLCVRAASEAERGPFVHGGSGWTTWTAHIPTKAVPQPLCGGAVTGASLVASAVAGGACQRCWWRRCSTLLSRTKGMEHVRACVYACMRALVVNACTVPCTTGPR